MSRAKLMVTLTVAAISASATPVTDADPAPTWVVDPQVPGENRPIAGRSTFDLLFTVEKRGKRIYKIPYPFQALAKEIDAHLPRVGSGSSRLSRVLLPLGRSLQRKAAAPDFFKYPRVVVAVDTEPMTTNGKTSLALKDRLYLGYQEKANIIEVISYNDDAGRFEFQVVRDYGPGLEPKVFYANRGLCIGCHQNGGPIFPAQLWDESDSNPEVAKRLLSERKVFYGAPVNRSFVPAISISASVDRANLFSAHQLLWREGCGNHQDSTVSIRCRASVFTSMLQYRLSGYRHFDQLSINYRDDFLTVIRENWQRRWPDGLAISNPKIPNRNPLQADNDISSALDPLNPRPPLEVWSVSSRRDVNRVITGLATHLATAEVRKLDQYLFARGNRSKAPRKVYSARCELTGKNLVDWLYRLWFVCRKPGNALNQGFGMDGWMYIEKNGRVRGMVNWLGINDIDALRDLELIDNGFELRDGQWLLKSQIAQNTNGLHARFANGSSVANLRFRWPDTGPVEGLPAQVPGHSVFPADVVLTVMDDFAPVHTVIAQMADETKASRTDVFSSQPFQRTSVMEVLFKQLGLTPTTWCCKDVAKMLAIKVDGDRDNIVTRGPQTEPPAATMKTFFRVCGACHQTRDRSPPNFLKGDARQIASNLKHCAERIFYRLHMWNLPLDKRPKSPMPPVNALAGIGIPLEQWRHSDELASLQRFTADLLMLEDRTARWPEELPSTGYGTLRACLPGTD